MEMEPTQAFDPAVVAKEIDEGITSVIAFVKMPNDQKVAVLKILLDKEIGTDEGAMLKTIPGMTPAITEMITDPLLDTMADMMVRKFFS